MYSDGSTRALPRVGFPIRRSRGQRLVSTSPGLIAAAHVLHRLSAPRHPPCALVLLIEKNTFHHYGVFKVRAARSDSHRWRDRAPVPQNSTACSNEVDVFPGETGLWTSRRTSRGRPSYRSKSSGIPYKGGDPAAASATATLLRL